MFAVIFQAEFVKSSFTRIITNGDGAVTVIFNYRLVNI